MSLDGSFIEKISPIKKIRKRLRNKNNIRCIDLTKEIEEVNINISVNYNEFGLDSSEIEYENSEIIEIDKEENEVEVEESEVEVEESEVEVEESEVEVEESEVENENNVNREVEESEMEEDSMDDFIDDSEVNKKDEEKVIQFLAKQRSKNRLEAIDSYKNTELEGRLLENIYKELATSVGYFHPGNDSLRKFIFKYYLKEQFPFEYPTEYKVENIFPIEDSCSVCGCKRTVNKQICFSMDVNGQIKDYQYSTGPECFERIDSILQTLKLAHQYFVLGESEKALNLELLLNDNIILASKQRKRWNDDNKTEEFI